MSTFFIYCPTPPRPMFVARNGGHIGACCDPQIQEDAARGSTHMLHPAGVSQAPTLGSTIQAPVWKHSRTCTSLQGAYGQHSDGQDGNVGPVGTKTELFKSALKAPGCLGNIWTCHRDVSCRERREACLLGRAALEMSANLVNSAGSQFSHL